jgi:hypothetical protein
VLRKAVQLSISETLADPEAYRETDHEDLAVVIEVAAAILLCRGTRYPTGRDHYDCGPGQQPAVQQRKFRNSPRQT